ncbi:MAG: tetratricopeptide repeat protein [Deltaproteobacteria bacterium]|nr:MAG: tetratricopeptide repeat protein [Deltaproteobacteria bacterium]
MKRLSIIVALSCGVAVGACGSSGGQVKSGGDPAQVTTGGDDGGTTVAGTEGDRRKLTDDEFTKRTIEDVKAPVYLDEIDHDAQDAFRDGVKIIASETPDYKKALEKFKAAAEKDVTFLEAFFNWGMVLERTGHADDALNIYQRALEKNPGDASAQAYIAKIYLAKAREAHYKGLDADKDKWLAQAKTLLDDLLAKEGENVAVNNAMALYYLFKDDLDTAERYVKEVLYVQPSNVTGLNTRGLINLKRGRFMIARWIFENKVLKEDPTSTEALTNLGYTYIKLDQRPLAMRFFTKALEADPENMAVRMNIAAMLLEHLDYQSALDHYEKVLVAQPTNLEAKIGRCDAKYGLGGTATDKKAAYDVAIGCYVAFLKEAPERTDLYKRIAETYQNKLQDYEKTIEFLGLYGKHAKLTQEELDQNQKTIKTLQDIIDSGGFGAMDAPGADPFADMPVDDNATPSDDNATPPEGGTPAPGSGEEGVDGAVE